MLKRLVIVGGGQAASSAAAKARELDADVSITMICAEDVLPYQRPPLSKKYLSGEMPLDRLVLRPKEWFAEQNVEVILADPVQSIDLAGKSVTTESGAQIIYDALLIATGSHARRLPASIGGNLPGVHVLRSTADADALSPILEEGGPVVIVGGGYIGLEVAAVARQAGLDVTLIEAADRILQRVAAPETSDYFRTRHLAEGVRIVERSGLNEIRAGETSKLVVELANGETLPADNVLCGIGIEPTIALAEAAGLECDNGIVVDDRCRTSDNDVFAAGDCANFEFRGSRIRLESVPNAINQAEVAAVNMLGGDEVYVATPWFWSDQYDIKLQIAGLNMGYDSTLVRPGKREGAQSVWYYQGDQLLAVDAMNDAPAFMMARRIIEAGKTVPKDAAANPESNLKEFA